ncbi:LicD family protein [Chloroflexota bacterium]
MSANDVIDQETLDRSKELAEPLDPVEAKEILEEVKQIFDQAGVLFFLRHGTCLGAIREKGFIPWDDDIDLGCVLGINGYTEEQIDPVVVNFRKNGFFARVDHQDQAIFVSMMKSTVRIEWASYRIFGDSIFQYPGIRIPVRFFEHLKEIDFLGMKVNVPNPPEEYLLSKYGEEWMIPKEVGFGEDVVGMIPEDLAPGRAGKLKQFFINTFLPWRTCRIKVFNLNEESVSGSEVMVVGLGRSKTNKQGYARFYLPYEDDWALVIKFAGHEELLYAEKVGPGKTYLYRPDAQVNSGRYYVLKTE